MPNRRTVVYVAVRVPEVIAACGGTACFDSHPRLVLAMQRVAHILFIVTWRSLFSTMLGSYFARDPSLGHGTGVHLVAYFSPAAAFVPAFMLINSIMQPFVIHPDRPITASHYEHRMSGHGLKTRPNDHIAWGHD